MYLNLPVKPMIEMSDIKQKLQELGDPEAIVGMAKFGIDSYAAYGVSMPKLRTLGKELGTDHELALRLWQENNRECKILAGLVENPQVVSEAQMEQMVVDFYDWEICDQTIMNVFEKTPFAYEKAAHWCKREELFVRRAGFVLMARLAVSDKKAENEQFLPFLSFIREGASDERHMVKKAVNWALRQIGKRNVELHKLAIQMAREVQSQETKSAKWIALDALRELESQSVVQRLQKKERK